jgi:hypothetical protein
MNLRSEIARLTQDIAELRGSRRGGAIQLICIRGGIPTASGQPECEINGTVLVQDDGEDFEDFEGRVLAEARMIGARFAVISGLPPRLLAADDDYPR